MKKTKTINKDIKPPKNWGRIKLSNGTSVPFDLYSILDGQMKREGLIKKVSKILYPILELCAYLSLALVIVTYMIAWTN